MGLFGFGNKKYKKNFSNDNAFLKQYAVKLNSILEYCAGHDAVVHELRNLQNDLETSIVNAEKNKKLKKEFQREYDKLQNLVEGSDWDEQVVITTVRKLKRIVVDITVTI